MLRQAYRLIAAWPLVAKRSLAHWRVLSSVVAGVLLASAIMSSSAIYLESLRHLALKHAINLRSPNQVDILASYPTRPIDRDDYERVAEGTVESAGEHLSWMLTDGVGAVKTATFYLTDAGQEEQSGGDDRRGYFAFAPRLTEFITLTPGSSMPGRRPSGDPTALLNLEAIVPADAAEELEYGIGDRVSLIPSWPGATSHVSVLITGTFERNDEDDLFSHLYRRSLQAGVVHTVRALPMFISEGVYLDVLGPALEDGAGVYAWMLDVAPDRLNDDNSAKAGEDILAFQREMTQEFGSFQISTALLQIFNEYKVRLFFTRAPMLVFLVLIAVVILYYVVTLSSLLVEQQRGEIALLRSRGATQRQILAVFVLEGATISLLAVALGPLIAAGAVSLLGLTPLFSELTGNELMLVSVSRASYVMSAVGGGLSFVALMAPALQAARVSVTRHRQESARPAQKPFFHRYYLDVLLLVVGMLLFRQLDEQGSVLAKDLLGEVVVNELLLAVPGLILIAVAMILLRLFPVAMSVSSRLLGRWLPAGLALGLWQMAREPTHYARLSLLLILTAGLGVFAASFVATLERSYQERVLYSTGSDVRVEGVRIDNSRFLATFSDRYERSSWVDTASPAFPGPGVRPDEPVHAHLHRPGHRRGDLPGGGLGAGRLSRGADDGGSGVPGREAAGGRAGVPQQGRLLHRAPQGAEARPGDTGERPRQGRQRPVLHLQHGAAGRHGLLGQRQEVRLAAAGDGAAGAPAVGRSPQAGGPDHPRAPGPGAPAAGLGAGGPDHGNDDAAGRGAWADRRDGHRALRRLG